ncbi:MAG: exonuclease subunit SbcD [Bacteroidales bacterium]|nr:exonuclease subunit SbcD [Bacteroidales bacterium]
MKVLHTADWHIGQIFHNYNREEEHKFFFDQLKSIVAKEKPDVLVVSGDVFHTAVPTILSQKLYYNFIVDLSRLDDDLQIVITSGNHDSPSRLEAPRPLWEAFNVTVVGMLDYRTDGDGNGLMFDASKIEIPVTRNGKTIGWVLAVPYMNAGNYPQIEGDASVSERIAAFYKSLLAHLKSRPDYDPGHSVVATGHLAVRSADIAGHNPDIIGKLETLDVEDFADMKGIDYWAFGHIHYPQAIRGMENMRYAGSPIPISFNENYQHSVVAVDIADGKAQSRVIPLKILIPIVDFPSKPSGYDDALPYETVLMKLMEILDEKAYVRLHVQADKPLTQPETLAMMKAFDGAKAMFCGIQSYFPEKKAGGDLQAVNTLQELKAMSPYELGCSVYQKKYGEEMPDELKELFKNVCEEAKNRP